MALDSQTAEQHIRPDGMMSPALRSRRFGSKMNSVDFSQWLDQLRELPTSASQWEHAKQFINDVAKIVEKKETQRSQIKELTSAVRDISERFSDELTFLGITPDTLSWPNLMSPSDPYMILEVISQLESSLIEFQGARSVSLETLQKAAASVGRNVEALKEHMAEAQSGDPVEAGSRAADIVDESTILPPQRTEPSGSEPTPKAEDNEAATLLDKENNLVDEWQPDEESTAIPDSMPTGEPTGDPEESSTTLLESIDRESEVIGQQPDDHVEESRDSGDDGNTRQRYGLEASEEVARRFLASESLYDLETLMWTLIAEEDLAGAYWLAQSLYDEDSDCVLSPTLLQALQASRWLSPQSNQYIEDVLEIVANYDDTVFTPAIELLMFATSIHASLIAPHSNIVGWLRVPKLCPELKGVESAVSNYVLTGNPPLRPEYITGTGESVRRQDGILKASLRATKWMADAAMKFGPFGRATSVWKFLTGPKGKITEMLSPVKENDHTRVDTVRAAISELQGDAAVEMIHRTDQLLEEGKTPKPEITGKARNWLLKGIAEATAIGNHWCELVEYENAVREGPKDTYLIQRINALRDEVESVSRLAIDTLTELTGEANPTDVAAAAECAKRSLEHVYRSLNIQTDCEIPDLPATVVEFHRIPRESDDLAISMTNRLLWTKVQDIDEEGRLTESASPTDLVPDLVAGISESMSLEQAIEQRIELQDYRFFEKMSSGVAIEKRERLKSLYTKAIQDSNATLKRNVEDIEKSVQQSVRDGVIDIDDDNWIMAHVTIEEVMKATELDHITISYPAQFGQLADIQDSLDTEKRRRLAQLQGEWEQEVTNLPNRDTPAVAAWEEKFSTAQESANIRVMEECVIRIRNHSSGELLPHAGWDDGGETTSDEIVNFVAFVDTIADIEEHARTGGGLNSLQDRLSAIDG